MKNCLRICDIYGQRFHLYIGYKPKFYTYFGGIISIISLISYILIFILLGYDDLKRKNPFSNTSTVPPSGYKNIKFGEEKIYLPWRIIDYDENPINITNIIYPRIFYFTVHTDNETGELVTQYNLIDYKLCNETSMKNLGNEYIIDIPLDTLYCIDMENLKVGGSWNADFLNFIRFDLYMCKDGVDYNESNFKCTSYDNLENIYGGGESVFFELLYPIVQFQPTNKDIPILVVYKTHYYIINKFLNKLDRLYLQEYVFQDEQSWIINHPKNESYWGVNSLDGESYIMREKDVLRFASNSKCYTLNIYFDLGIVYFTRKYKKLYEIIGEIFPVINVLYYIFEFMAKKLNEAYAAKKLNEYIMGYEINKEKKSLILIKNQNLNRKSNKSIEDHSLSPSPISRKNNSIILFKNNTHLEKKGQSDKIVSNSFEDVSNIICNPNNGNGNININKKNITKSNKSNHRESVKQKEETNITNNKKKSIVKYPLKYYFYGMLYMKLNYSYKDNNLFFGVSGNFIKSYTYYRNIIDITSYIKMYKDFELYKKLALRKESEKNDENIEKNKNGNRSRSSSQHIRNYLY